MFSVRCASAMFALASGVAASFGQVSIPDASSSTNCQVFDDSLNFSRSNWQWGPLAADDFVADGSTLSQVRVWGFYYEFYEGGDCAPPLTFDHFRIRILENDPITGRRPGVVFAESIATSQHFAIADSQVESYLGSVMYEIDLALVTPISGLIPGQVYWLEVSNDLTNAWGQPVGCTWFWSERNQTSSSYFWFATPEGGCSSGGPYPSDLAFCTNFDLGQSPVGALPGACCTCDGLCAERTLKECDDVDGHWDVERISCTGVVCDTTPSNDNCADGPPLISTGFYTIPKTCTTTDGYNPIETEYGPSRLEEDVWFKFIAPANCELRVDTCWAQHCLDSMLAVYHDPDNPTACPPCALMSDPNGAAISVATLAGMGADDTCSPAVGGGGIWTSYDQLGRDALPGECFLIRVGSYYSGPREGDGLLHVTCGPPPNPVDEPNPVRKSRFLSFVVPPSGFATPATALEVQFEVLHYVNPPYTGGLSQQFTAFQGTSGWIGPPTLHFESTGSGTPFYASSVQCTPFYQDWSTIGLLQVTGSSIVPSSVYRVRNVSAECRDIEDICDAKSNALVVRTSRWGDVEAPYNPPSTTDQPDAGDISALVNKFKNAAGAPIKAQALLAGENARGAIDITPDLSFAHISACVDAFKGSPYPYKPGKCTGNENKACATVADCSNAPNPMTGPCVLCP